MCRATTLGEFTTTDRVDPDDRRPIGSKTAFSAHTDEIWATALLSDGQKSTAVGLKLLDLGPSPPRSLGIRMITGAEGNRHVAFNVREGLAPGRYRATFLLNRRAVGSVDFSVGTSGLGISATAGGTLTGGPQMVGAARPYAPDPVAPAPWIAAVLDFRRHAVRDGTGVWAARIAPRARRRLEELEAALWTCIRPAAGWSWFLNHAPFTFGAVDADRPVCVFYQPFADVALVLEWERHGDGYRIRDLECLPAEVLRRKGQPPFNLNYPWHDPGLYPPEGMARRFRDTIHAWEGLVPPISRKPWRTRLGLEPPELAETILRPAASLLLGQALLALDEFRFPVPEEPAAAPALRTAMENIRRQAAAGKFLDVLAAASATPPPSAEAIRAAGPDAFRDLHVAHVLLGPESAFVFAVDPRQADFCLSFAFRADRRTCQLVRIDLIHYAGLYQATLPEETP